MARAVINSSTEQGRKSKENKKRAGMQILPSNFPRDMGSRGPKLGHLFNFEPRPFSRFKSLELVTKYVRIPSHFPPVSKCTDEMLDLAKSDNLLREKDARLFRLTLERRARMAFQIKSSRT